MTTDHIAPWPGYASFSRALLRHYDNWVLGAVCRYAWRCPADQILVHYQRHLSGNHLEVGVGTGYFLANLSFPQGRLRLALLDMNANCLDFTAKRLARLQPERIQANVLAPIPCRLPGFDSIALNYVLHCLPGNMAYKAAAFGHLKALLNPGGTLFGATVLHEGSRRNPIARAAAGYLNARRIFSNRQDDRAGLEAALRTHFDTVEIDMVGAVARFAAR
jgi:hypothetical protein